MPVTEDSASQGRRTLIVVASALEASPLLRALGGAPTPPAEWTLLTPADTIDLVVSGIGKANAASAVGKFGDSSRHGRVLSIGIAGVLPGVPGLSIGDAVLASVSRFADEGIETPDGWQTCAQMGFALCSADEGSGINADPGIVALLRSSVAAVGPIATVSTCSGTDALAGRVRERTHALAEAMEGAAVLLAASRLGIAGGELRVISNTTGERRQQHWDMPAALRGLESVIGRVEPILAKAAQSTG